MSLPEQTSKVSSILVTSLTGGCHCGAVSYEFPVPPGANIGAKSEAYAKHLVTPSQQRFPERGSRPNQDKWRASHCHCGACRRTVGALMIDWVNIPSKVLSVSRKGPTGKYMVSDHATREFCQTCGTSLFFDDEKDPEGIDVTVASIATPELFDYIEFDGHFWVQDVATLNLSEEARFGGLAGLIVDNLPRTMGAWGSGSEPFDKV